MITRKVRQGSIGIEANCWKNGVLLQIDDEKSQARVVLSKKDTEDLIQQLTRYLSELQIPPFSETE